MGSNIEVTDIDLLRVNSSSVPTEIIELKRSRVSLDMWLPYERDYHNFFLLSNLANMTGCKMYIVYNKKNSNVEYEDISKLKIFNFDIRDRMYGYWKLLGYKDIGEFIESSE